MPEKDKKTIEISGLDEIFASAMDMEVMLGKYERFAEHVVLACAMPENPRYTIQDEEIEGTLMPQAFEMLDKILVRYRKMTKWFRNNGIDLDAVVGDGNDKKSKS